MNLKQLETFLLVATLGNFRKAAERLFTTQPAVSTRIASLENELGVRLFERSPGSVRLTAKGQELLPYAEKVLRSAENLRERAGDTSSISGVLRLGVSETIVHTLLPLFLARLHEAFPKVAVDLTVDITLNLRNELVARSLDLAFLMGPVSESSIANYHLCTFPLVWAASPKLDLPKRKRLGEADLVRFPIITYARHTRPFAEVQTRLREAAEDPPRIFASTSLAACLRMTLDGIGIGTLPLHMIEKELAAGSLRKISCTWVPSDLGFTASYPVEPWSPLVEQAALLAQKVASQPPA